MSFYLNSFYVVFSMVFAIGWSFPFLIAPLIGLRFYVFTENKVVKIIKRLPKVSSLVRNEDAEGWIIGWPFIGYIYHVSSEYNDDRRELYIFTTKRFMERHLAAVEVMDHREHTTDSSASAKPIPPLHIHLYEREGCYSYLRYTRRLFDVQPFEAMANQQPIVKDIIAYYTTHRHAVIILHGEKGVGKSMIPLLVAKELATHTAKKSEDTHVSFCDTHKPTDPGDHFSQLYLRVDPTRHSPLIVTMEEFDGILHAVHHNTIARHEDVTTAIYDKASWNQFFDRFDRGYYPWTLLFLTTNQDPETFHRMDASYLRVGRINLTFHVPTAPVHEKTNAMNS